LLLPPDAAAGENRVRLAGRLVSRGALRHTPAGIAVVEFVLGHESRQEEGGLPRQVSCEVACLCLGATANLLASAGLGERMCLSGFLAARSSRNPGPVLHVTEIEFQEGNRNGIQT
jgi:primosomal replication protein N